MTPTASNHPFVSVVVLSWNTLEDIKKCLASIRGLTYRPKEIVVVDNGSTDGSKPYLQSQDDIVLVDLPFNTGFSGGQVAARKAARGEFLALLNSDAVVASNWLNLLVDTALACPTAAAIGGRAYMWDETNEKHNTSAPFYSYQRVDPNSGYTTTMMSGASRCTVDSISGAGVLIRVSAVEEVGYFEERFFAYFEETDLFARFIRTGYEIVYEPAAHLWHKIGQSSNSYFYLYQMHRNRFLFAVRNFDPPYLRRFLKLYVVEGIFAAFRLTVRYRLEDYARVRALLWNVANIRSTLRSREDVQALGGTYSQDITARKPPDDITVIIPAYNYGRYLGQAIDSVLIQTLRPKRILVIDDGSTDDTPQVLTTYSGCIEVIRKSNEGVVPTKNLGIQLSETTWTLFLDADDELPREYLAELYETANSHGADVVYTDMQLFGARNELLTAGHYSLARLLAGNFIHNSSLISTDILKRSRGYKIEMKDGFEDWELYVNLAKLGGKFAYCTSTTLHYRRHAGALGRDASARQRREQFEAQVFKLHRRFFLRQRFPAVSRRWAQISLRLLTNPKIVSHALVHLPATVLLALHTTERMTLGELWKHWKQCTKDSLRKHVPDYRERMWPDRDSR